METITINNEVTTKKPNKIVRLCNYVFQNKLNTFIFLTLVLSLFTLYLMIYPTYFGSFINYGTDDVAEYHIYIDSFFRKIKTGTLSLYDTGLYGGTSFFSGVYYFAIDLFTLFAFVLSYFVPTAIAFTLSMLLRIYFGTMIIYYVFIRKGYKPFVCFLIAFIYFTGGVTQTELVFPVYVGVCFYAPLAMLLVDLVIEKGNRYWLLIPIYGAVCIVYDYYISYMLFAFMAVFFVIEMHLHEEKFFLLTKKFYIKLAMLLGLILFSILLAAGFALPSIYYMLNESLRSSQAMDKSIWLFAETGSATTPWLPHYFAQWCNIFMPNDPFSLCLIPTGKYIREHATLYITAGGLIYLSYFFFIWGKTENRLKFWVLLFNIMFAIPLFSMIFTFNGWPYVRWFFIPLLINLYAAAMAMNKKSFNIGVKPYTKILPLILIAAGFGTLLMVLITKTDLFMHYNDTNYFYYPILIGALAFLGIYIIIMFLIIIFEIIKKYKALRVLYVILPILILGEAFYSGFITFSNIGDVNYLKNTTTLKNEKEHLYEIGYKDIEGYRVGIFSKPAKNTTNTNVLIDKANTNSFFQSFYNVPLDYYYRDICNMSTFSGWSRSTVYGYGMLDSNITNTKYIIEEKDCNWINLPEKYYEYYGDYTDSNKVESRYYSLKNMPQFIVYDNVFNIDSSTRYNKMYYDIALLSHGYVAINDTNQTDKNLLKHLETNQKKIEESGIKFVDIYDVITEAKSKVISQSFTGGDEEFLKGYETFDLTDSRYDKIFKKDVIAFIPNSSKIYADDGINFYFYYDTIEGNTDSSKGHYDPLLYNNFYPGAYEPIDSENNYYRPTKIVVSKREEYSSQGVLYAYNFDVYDNFINQQNEYTNRIFTLDGNKMHIEFNNNNNDVKIIKTAYAYSDDWIINSEGYDTCDVDGGFLGIIVPKNTQNINVDLTYIPAKVELGCKITIISSIIYVCGIAVAFIVPVIIKKKKNTEVETDESN